jgi:23S rRNA (cytidine1920-2'-O)/16S rRNA (cytidine1409-2'-O)-methyltransferase
MKTRLDRLLVDRGLVESREKAQALIMAGEVLLNGQKASKPGQPVDPGAALEVLARPPYVSRGGLKLAALSNTSPSTSPARSASISDRPPAASPTPCCRPAPPACTPSTSAPANSPGRCAPIRASPARRHQRARTAAGEIGEPVDLLTCDVSFISVTLILPAAVPLLQPRGQMVILIKPQFEVGKGQVGKGGIVRDPQLHRAACDRVTGAVREFGFETGIMDSPILGAEGNKEFLLYAHH